jgi:transposase InsO family protein
MGRYLRVNLLGPGPRLMKKRIYRAVVSQRLRNPTVRDLESVWTCWGWGESSPLGIEPRTVQSVAYVLNNGDYCN